MGVYCPTSAISEALEEIRYLWLTYRSSEFMFLIKLISTDIQTEMTKGMRNLCFNRQFFERDKNKLQPLINYIVYNNCVTD